jgi:hypothetical protein
MGRIETKTPDVDSILRFLRSNNPIRPSYGRNRVSNVAPGLQPGERHAVEDFFKKRAHTDKAVEEKEAADKHAETDEGGINNTQLEQQIGRPMHRREIIKRLEKLNPNFYFEQSKAFPEIMGIYLPDDRAEMRDGRRVRHICGFEFGYSPEFTVYNPDAVGSKPRPRAKKITRGWRALILILSHRGYIEFSAACKAFNISPTARKKWHNELRKLSRRR